MESPPLPTTAQVLAMSANDAAAKAGKKLSQQPVWSQTGISERGLWATCQGSDSYLMQVELRSMTSSCSCPSRQFPCKHVLGLLLYWIENPARIPVTSEPEHVATWLDKREKSQQKTESPKAPPSQASQESRHKKVIAGITLLQQQLQDWVRKGIALLPQDNSVNGLQKRMVDAQAPGLAAMLGNILELIDQNKDWELSVLQEIAQLYLLCESYKRIETLNEDLQQDLRWRIGYPQGKEEALSSPPVTDYWQVAHVISSTRNAIGYRQYWLCGLGSGKVATILEYGQQNLISAQWRGHTPLHYYPGRHNLRAMLPTEFNPTPQPRPAVQPPDLPTALEAIRQARIENPFLLDMPLFVGGVVLARAEDRDLLLDPGTGIYIPLLLSSLQRLLVLSLTEGKAFAAFLLPQANGWTLHAIWHHSHMLPLPHVAS